MPGQPSPQPDPANAPQAPDQGPHTPQPNWSQPQQGGWTPPPFQPQPQFGPPPPGYGPHVPPGTQPPKTNKGVLIAVLSASVALILVLAVVLIVVAGNKGGGGGTALTPKQKSAQAATKLNSVPALRYTGTYDSSGTSVQADLSVTRAGTAAGTLTANGSSIDVMLLDGDLYVKAPASYWRDQSEVGADAVGDFADKWAKAPSSLRSFDIRRLLVPSALGQALQQAQPLVPPSGAPAAEVVSGRRALVFEGSEGQYYVSDDKPFQLVKVKSGGGQVFDFAVTELTADAVGTFYTELKDKVKNGLAGALDPASKITYTAAASNSSCTSSGCTIKRKVANDGPTATATYVAKIWKDKAGAKELGQCSKTLSVRAGSSTLECRVTSGGWKAWVRGLKPGSTNNRYYFNSWLRIESVSKSKADALLGKLDAEQQGA